MTASSSATLFTCSIEALSSSLAASSSLLTLSRRALSVASSVTSSAMMRLQRLLRSATASRTKSRTVWGVGLDNQAVVRGLTGMGLETSPQPAGIREVCRKPQ